MDLRYKKLGVNTFIVFVGQAGSSLVSLLMLPLYTSWLSTEEYGAVDLMSTYASILLSLITCCVADAIFIFPKDVDDCDKKKYFTSGLLFVFITTIICLLLNFILVQLYNEGNFLKIYSWHTIALTVSMFLQRYMQQFTRCLEKMKVFATTGIVYTICVALFAILLIPYFKLNGYVLSLIIANAIAALYSFVFSKSHKYFSVDSFCKPHLKTLVLYGIPLIPNSIMWWMVNGLNRPIMEAYLGLSALGLYAVASKFPSFVSMIANVFSNAWGISMLDEYGKPGFDVFFNKAFKLITFISVITSFFLIVFSKEVISLFASDAFFDAWHVLPMLVVGTVLNTSTGLIGGVFMAMKKSKYFFYSSAGSAIASVVFTILLAKYFGLIGCAVAAAISFAVGCILRLVFAWKQIKGFEWSIYLFSLILLIILNIILEIDISSLLKYTLYLIVLISIILLYKDVLNSLTIIVKQRWIKY